MTARSTRGPWVELPPTGPEMLKQVTGLVAYAEVRAIMVAWVGERGWDAVTQLWAAVREVLEEELQPGTELFGRRVSDLLRESSRMALEPALRRGGPWPFDRTIARGQVGSFAGLDEVFDEAGQLAIWHRATDPRLISVAIRIVDYVRRRPSNAARD